MLAVVCEHTSTRTQATHMHTNTHRCAHTDAHTHTRTHANTHTYTRILSRIVYYYTLVGLPGFARLQHRSGVDVSLPGGFGRVANFDVHGL